MTKWMMVLTLACAAMFVEVTMDAVDQPVGVSLGAEAQAQFTAKVKRIKIKKKRVGSGFKIVGKTSGGDASSQGAVRSTLRVVAGNEDDAQVFDLNDYQRRNSLRRAASDANTNALAGDKVTFSIYTARSDDDQEWTEDDWEEADDGYTPAERTTLEGLSGDASVALGDSGWKVRARLANNGALNTVVFHESKDVTARVVGITYQVEGSDEVRLLPIQEYRQTWTTDLELAPEVIESAARLQMETDLLDTDGQVIATRVEDVTVEDAEGLDVGLSRISLGQTRRGDVKLSTWTVSEGNAASLQVEVTDLDTQEVVLSTLDEAPVETTRVFANLIAFEPGEPIEAFPYLVLVDLINAEGDPVGQQYELDLMAALHLGPEGVYGEESFFPFADGQGLAALLPREEGGYALYTVWSGESSSEVASINIIFEEPFEGPAPLETEVNTQLVAQIDKWVQKGDGAMPASASVSAVLSASDGQVLEEVETSGEGGGTVFRTSGNGKGTKKASAQVQQQQIPLL